MMSFLPSQKNHPIRFGRVYCHWPLLVQTFLPWAARQQLLQAFHWFSQSPCGSFHPWHLELFLRCVHRGKFWIYPAIFGERKFELTENRTFMRIRHVDTEILEINAPQTNITHSICSKFPGPEDPEEAAPSHVSAMRRLLTVVLIGKTGAKASNDDAKRATDAINRYGDMMKKTSLWCATESNAGCDERSNESDHALFSMKCHCRERTQNQKTMKTENPWRHGNLSFYPSPRPVDTKYLHWEYINTSLIFQIPMNRSFIFRSCSDSRRPNKHFLLGNSRSCSTNLTLQALPKRPWRPAFPRRWQILLT